MFINDNEIFLNHFSTFWFTDQVTTQVAIPNSKSGKKKNPEGLSERCENLGKTMFSKKQLYKKVPILEWLPKYNLETGVADLIAGVTVGLTVIPQGIAYALVAKLPPQVCGKLCIYQEFFNVLHF